MSTPANLEESVLFLVQHAPAPLGITKVMKLLFLADVEHMQLYGEPLTDVVWIWHHHGPFSATVYGAVEELDEADRVHDVLFLDGRRTVLPDSEGNEAIAQTRLSVRARRALTRVLDRFGGQPLAVLKQAAYATETMRRASPGQRLDLSPERRPPLADSVPGLAALLERTPPPDNEEWGDPAMSAAEDLEIMRAFSGLRREANREIE